MPTIATPASDDESALLLYGVFRALIVRQVPLSVSDYLDAVRVIHSELRSEDLTSVVSRRRVRRLCELLWTRSPEEVRLLHRVFDDIAPPTDDEIAELRSQLEAGVTTAPGLPGDARDRDGQRIAGTDATDTATTAGPERGQGPRVAVSFESAGRTGGLPVPRPDVPGTRDAAWVLQPQTVLSARALAILWRRYRRLMRVGPRTEFDLDATIAGYVRQGVLDRPAFRARRSNAARLLILADASPSMAPWYPFLSMLGESLGLSRLHGAELWFFANLPRRTLFTSSTLADGQSLTSVLSRFQGAGLLIVGDAGAARGAQNRIRARQTTTFLAEMARQMRSVVWVNPMPIERWRGTTAAAIADAGIVPSFPLEPSAMIRAVDVLRGTRAS